MFRNLIHRLIPFQYILLTVTADDLEKGDPQDIYSCPVALALEKRLASEFYPTVTQTTISYYSRNSKKNKTFLYEYKISTRLSWFIIDIDKRTLHSLRCNPFLSLTSRFLVRVPRGILSGA